MCFTRLRIEARKNGMGVAVHIAQDGVYPMNAVQDGEPRGLRRLSIIMVIRSRRIRTQTIQKLPPDYNYSSEPDRFLETGRAWLQADVGKLHGEVIHSLLETMHRRDSSWCQRSAFMRRIAT